MNAYFGLLYKISASLAKCQIYLDISKACTNFNDYVVEDTRRLGIKNKKNNFPPVSIISAVHCF